MALLDSLERRFGRFAIPGLIRIVAGFNALVFVLARLNPEFVRMLDLNRGAILHGQVWRLVTYIFIPTTDSPFWIIFAASLSSGSSARDWNAPGARFASTFFISSG